MGTNYICTCFKDANVSCVETDTTQMTCLLIVGKLAAHAV